MAAEPDTGGPRSVEKIWARTRQGARNVAGVRYQTGVAGYLLARTTTADRLITSVTPEGLEDIDCVRTDGRHLLVQAKERAGGATTFAVGNVAEAVLHAREALEAKPTAELAIVTNARPGRGLADTGWDTPLATVITEKARKSLLTALAPLDDHAVEALLSRCYLICFQWGEITGATRIALSAAYELPAAAGDLLRVRLLSELETTSAEQRNTTPATATTHSRADVDAFAARVREVVDVASLDSALRDGLVEHVDFTSPSALDVEQFLRGVDVTPSHIAAGLDVLRADELAAIFAAIADERNVVIAGPSGSGKSALMWRAAYELGRSHRLVRVLRVASENVSTIVRWVRSLQPAPETPVLICADDLGGAQRTSAWPELASRLLDLPGVHLIGCAREEDFAPNLIGDGVALRPELSEALAMEIEAQLIDRDIRLTATAAEALPDARGLLMEFVAILTTGRRLEQVLATQIHERLGANRAVERDALRFVAATHRLGLDLPASVLGDLCGNPPGLTAALKRLESEFMVLEVDGAWRGLHELRSEIAHQLLHDTPPPSAADTYAALADKFDAISCAHLIRRVADRGGPLQALFAVVDRRIAEQSTSGPEARAWLDAAIAADVATHVHACVEATIESWPVPDRPILRMAWLRRFGRLPDDVIPDEMPLDDLADKLPEPHTQFAASAAAAIAPERLGQWLNQVVDGADAVALTEALAAASAHPALAPEDVRRILHAWSNLPIELFSRLVHALWVLAPASHGDPARWFSGRNLRLDRLAAEDTSILKWTAEPDDETPDQQMVLIDLFLAWGTLPTSRVRAVSQLVLDLCPDVVRVSVGPLGPQGIVHPALVEGGGRVHRDTYANPQVEGRRPRLMHEAIDRAQAAGSWAERLAQQRQVLTAVERLLDEAFVQLLDDEGAAADRNVWAGMTLAAKQLVDALPGPPVAPTDGTYAPDATKDTLDRLIMELRDLPDAVARPAALRKHGIGLRRALTRLWLPYRPADDTAAKPLSVSPTVTLLADLLLALEADRSQLGCCRPDDGTPYTSVAQQVVEGARARALLEEQAALKAAMGHGVLTTTWAPGAAPLPGLLTGGTWLVGVSPDRQAWPEALYLGPGRLDEARAQFVGRVIVIQQIGEMVVPAVAFRLTAEDVGLIPAAEARLAAEAAGAPTLSGAGIDHVLEFRDVLAQLSATCANQRLREPRFGVDALVRRSGDLLRRAEDLAVVCDVGQPTSDLVQVVMLTAREELAGTGKVSHAAGMAALAVVGRVMPEAQLLDELLHLAIDRALADANATA